MRNLILLILTLALTACNESGGSDKKSSSPDSSTPAVTQPSDPTTPTTDPQTQTPAPAPTPSPTPAPTPTPQADLSCYYNAGAFCTGGNLGSTTVQLDLNAMFLAGNPQAQITQTTITNSVVATSSQTCAQPNGVGCFANSVCVEVSIAIQGYAQLFHVMKCGDAVNSSNQFEDL